IVVRLDTAPTGAVLADAVSISEITPIIPPADSKVMAGPDRYHIKAGETLDADPAGGLLANDSHLDGAPLTASLLIDAPNRNGATLVQPDGAFQYAPAPGFVGTDWFVYSVTDGQETDFGLVEIVVDDGVPVAYPDQYQVQHGQTLTVDAADGVLSNDVDASTLSAVPDPTDPADSGDLVLNADGSFTYTPTTTQGSPDFTGVDQFSYYAVDALGQQSEPVTVTILVTNDPPLAAADSFHVHVRHDPTTPVDLDVLANDTDDDSQLEVTIVTPPAQDPQATVNPDGTIRYTPPAGFVGTDSFQYKINDGVADSQTITATVVVENDVPQAADDLYFVPVNSTLDSANVLANDIDNDTGDTLLVLDGSLLYTGPGTVTLNPDGTFSYTPATDYVGTDSFSYKATDGHALSQRVVASIVVTDQASVARSDTYEVSLGVPLNVPAPGVLANDWNLSGNLTVTGIFQGPTNGSLGGNTINADGSLTYTPTVSIPAVDTVIYALSDGTQGTVTLNLTNTPPAVPLQLSYAVLRGATLTVPLETGLLSLAYDLDEGQDLAVTGFATTGPGTFSYQPDGSFTYIPPADQETTLTITYKVDDGFAQSDTVTVTLNATNNPPVALPDRYTGVHSRTLTIPAGQGLFANDHDDPQDNLDVVSYTQPSKGSVTVDMENGGFTYTPSPASPGYAGTDTFTYTLTDGLVQITGVLVTIELVNSPPVAIEDTYRAAYAAQIDIDPADGLLANDIDADEDPLVAVLVAVPDAGAGSLSGLSVGDTFDGGFSFIPASVFTGPVTFSYAVRDGALLADGLTPVESDPVTVTLEITDGTPTTNPDVYFVEHGSTLDVTGAEGVLANDWELAQPGALQAELDNVDNITPAVGTLAFPADGSPADGSFTFEPASAFVGRTTFTYTARNGSFSSAAETVTIEVLNTAPVAVSDFYTTQHDENLVADETTGLLANDIDLEGNQLMIVLDTSNTSGAVVLDTDAQGYPTGGFTYQPAAGFTGRDTFQYTLGDGAAESQKVTVTIDVANFIPIATVDYYQVRQGEAITKDEATGLLANDLDLDEDDLDVFLIGDPIDGFTLDPETGGFTYDPPDQFEGIVTFTYQADDGVEKSQEATVTFEVTNSPPLGSDDFYSGSHGTLEVSDSQEGLLANDSDLDGDTLTIVAWSTPTQGTISAADDTLGTFTYVPNDPNWVGEDTFTYTVSDGAEQVEVTVTIQLTNGPPIGLDGRLFTDQDTSLSIDTAADLLADAIDPDGDPLTATLASAPAYGSLGTVAPGDVLPAAFTYTPNSGYTGPDTFTYVLADGVAGGASDPVTVHVLVTDNSLVATDNTYEASHGSDLVVRFGSVLADDWSASGGTLTAVLDDPPDPALGTVDFQADGTFTFTPTGDYTGPATFTYHAEDNAVPSNQATVTINYTDRTPEAVPDSYPVPHGSSIELDVAANDTDDPVDVLSAVLVTPVNLQYGTLTPSGTGSFLYTPLADTLSGTDTFQYKAVDPAGNESAAATVTVEVLNTAPGTRPDFYRTPHDTPLTVTDVGIGGAGVLANDWDDDGDRLVVTGLTYDGQGTVSIAPDGQLTYNPQPGTAETVTLTYTVKEADAAGVVYAGSVEKTETVTIDVWNFTPVAQPDAFRMHHSDGSVSGDVLVGDFDGDGDALQAVLPAQPDPPTTAGSLGGITSGDSFSGNFTYTPNADFVGTDSFTYYASDGVANSNTVTVTIDVWNNVPVARNDQYSMHWKSAPLTVSMNDGLLANDFQWDGDPMTVYEVDEGGTAGSLSWNPDGSFSYFPAQGFAGLDTFRYRLTDDQEQGNWATVSIDVQNRSPQAYDDVFVGHAGTPIDVSGLTADDWDPDGDPLTATLTSVPGAGSLGLGAGDTFTGTVTYTPNAPAPGESYFVGVDSFTYSVSDGIRTATATVAVHLTNAEPVAVDDFFRVPFGQSLTSKDVSANDHDPDGTTDPLTYALVGSPDPNVTESFAFRSNGTFDFTPNAGFSGTATFTYQTDDGRQKSRTATATILVVEGRPVGVEDYATTAWDVALSSSGEDNVLDNDWNAQGEKKNGLSVAESVTLTIGDGGSLLINTDGSYSYTPPAEWPGTSGETEAEFELAYDPTGDPADPQATGSAGNLHLRLIRPKLAAHNDQFFMAADGASLSIPGSDVLANDYASDRSLLQVYLYVNNSWQTSGTITTDNDGDVTLDGTNLTYSPNGFAGIDSFQYALDAGDNATATVNVYVIDLTAASDAVNVNASQWNSGEVPAFGATGPDGYPVDIAGYPLYAELDEAASTPSGDFQFYPDGTYAYRPGDAASGTESFSYYVTNGVQQSPLAQVTFNITPVANSAPVKGTAAPGAKYPNYTVHWADTLNVGYADGLLKAGNIPSALWSDADLNTLTFEVNTDPGTGNNVEYGTLTLGPAGTFTYEPNPGADNFATEIADGVLQDTFDYTVSDGVQPQPVAGGTVNISIRDSAPMRVSSSVGAGVSYYVEQGGTLNTNGGSHFSLGDVFSSYGSAATPAVLASERNETLTFEQVQVDVNDPRPKYGNLQLNNNGTFVYTNASR
ncbi:MAG: Ig-like domain-containing protein, partial [Pirellulales bacterium]